MSWFPVLCTLRYTASWAWRTLNSEQLFFQEIVLTGDHHTSPLWAPWEHGFCMTSWHMCIMPGLKWVLVHLLLYSHLDDYLKCLCHCITVLWTTATPFIFWVAYSAWIALQSGPSGVSNLPEVANPVQSHRHQSQRLETGQSWGPLLKTAATKQRCVLSPCLTYFLLSPDPFLHHRWEGSFHVLAS